MATRISFAGEPTSDKWTDFYARSRTDGGPFQALFETKVATLARKTEGHFNSISKLTETITGSDYGNMLLVPGRKGTMLVLHHGFACNTTAGFSLAFAHGNFGDTTSFKTVDRDELVAPAVGGDEGGGETDGGGTLAAPSLESMMQRNPGRVREPRARGQRRPGTPSKPLPNQPDYILGDRGSEINLLQRTGIHPYRSLSDGGRRR